MQVRLRRQLGESRAKASAKVSSLGLAPADGNVSAIVGTVSPSSHANKPSMDHGLSDGIRAPGASRLKRRRETGSVARIVSPEEQAVADATALLLSFQAVRSPSGQSGLLRPKDVGSGGWCFYLAFFEQLGSRVLPSPMFLALLSLERMACRHADFEQFVQGVDEQGVEIREVCEARAVLAQVLVFHDLDVVRGLTPFECVVLDKFEGVISGDLLESRRYVDDNEMQVLLEISRLELLVLESNDLSRTEADMRSRLYPSHEIATNGRAQQLFQAGKVDMVIVRYELAQYLHYVSVEFDNGAPWCLDASRRSALEECYRQSGMCKAVLDGDHDSARLLLLALLRQ